MSEEAGRGEKTSFAIMDRALEAGINFWDTANVYGNDGLTERVLGNWFERSRRRDEVVLATKFRFRIGKGPNDTGASRHHLRSSVEQSLRRLKTDRIDLYQLHMQDIDTPEEETLREHVSVCEQFGLGILPWSPLAGGFLSGKYRKGQPPPEASRLAKWKDRFTQFDTPRHWRILDAVNAVAAELIEWASRSARYTRESKSHWSADAILIRDGQEVPVRS